MCDDVRFPAWVYEQHGEIEQDLRGLEEAARDLFASARSNESIPLGGRPRLLNRMCLVIATGHAWRGAELTAAIVTELGKYRFLSALILLRALMETEAAAGYAANKLGAAVETGRLDEVYDDLLPRLAQGNRFLREHRDEDHPESPNVLTMIDFTDRHYQRLGAEADEDIGSVREYYDFLSEFAHPCQGSIHYYATPENDVVRFENNPQDLEQVVRTANGSSRLLLLFLQQLRTIRDPGEPSGDEEE